MLPAPTRMTTSAEFDTAVRRGVRAGSPALVVHYLAGEGVGGPGRPLLPRVGFVVGRAVGGAVVRNQVRRRLRHLMRSRIERLPAGSAIVVRASGAVAGRNSAELGQELDRLLDRVLRRDQGRRR